MTNAVTRVGDLEREAARARLVEAYAAGQIDGPELEDRAAGVWAAARAAELAAVVDDLGEEPAPPAAAGARFVRDLLVFLICGAIAVLAWHVTGRGFFWPVWVLVYTGLPLLRFLFPRSAAHARRGLPPAERQSLRTTPTGSHLRDVEYAAYGLVVELDGALGHAAWRDQARDADRALDDLAASGTVTARLRWHQVFDTPCRTAQAVARILRARGWAGSPAACSGDCAVAADPRSENHARGDWRS